MSDVLEFNRGGGGGGGGGGGASNTKQWYINTNKSPGREGLTNGD